MIALKPVIQETESSCGPAVCAMLLSHLNKKITQNEFIQAAEVQDWLEEHGTQPHHMAKAVSSLAPDLEYWLKNKATLENLEFLVHQNEWPVAVNWQGLFYDTPEEEPSYPSADKGHYSVVVDVNVEKDLITLIDPYPDFSGNPRTFSLQWFAERWWDVGDHLDSSSGKITKFLTNKLLFLITPKNETFPLAIDMTNSFIETNN